MTYIEKARQIWPGLSDEQAHALLINVTCYPFGPDIWVWRQLAEARDMSQGDVDLAIQQAHEATERGMQAHYAALSTDYDSVGMAQGATE